MDRSSRRAGRPGVARLAGFASGDFACNLFWQSVTLYLLFFYTDILALPPGTAGVILMAGAVWHGVADVAVGIAAQRGNQPYRQWVIAGAVPLGLAFVLLYAPWRGGGTVVAAFAAQFAFRALYAVVNVPYAAWSTRISDDSGDRSALAGLRMLFGTAAAMLVALGTPWIVGHSDGGYLTAAAVIAAVATPLLLVVATTAPEALPAAAPAPVPIAACLRALAANRAFVTLNAAMAAAGVAAAVLNQSVLYYFTHVLRDPGGGPATLALMGLAGTAFVPLWMVVSARLGSRAGWIVAAGGGIACAAVFALSDGGRTAAQMFCVVMQGAFVGLYLCFWAMLPDTVDYGEDRTGIRVEAVAFGVAALVQKLALAAAAGIIGLAYAAIGYRPTQPSAGAMEGIHALMLWAPAAGLAVSIAAMAANPLRRGVHARIIERLRG